MRTMKIKGLMPFSDLLYRMASKMSADPAPPKKKKQSLAVNKNQRLTNEQVAEIRAKYVPGKRGKNGHPSNAKQLAEEYGTSENYVKSLIYGGAREKYNFPK